MRIMGEIILKPAFGLQEKNHTFAFAFEKGGPCRLLSIKKYFKI